MHIAALAVAPHHFVEDRGAVTRTVDAVSRLT